MPISRAVLPVLFGMMFLSGTGGFSHALEAPQSTGLKAPPFESPRHALRSGMLAYNNGKIDDALNALQFAATRGDSLALWKLGRIYADGDGVLADDLKAFEYFSKIADEHADESPYSPKAGIVSNAFVALGTYFLEGIPGTYVKSNPHRAYELLHYAAAYFGNPSAQYLLAKLYRQGAPGIPVNTRQAARWLNLAADKGHYQAQGLLGHILISGEGVPRQRGRGLMWLMLAKESADPVKDVWLIELYNQAQTRISDQDRQDAMAQLEIRAMRQR